MELTEAHDLLMIAAAFDNREPSSAADHAWAAALGHVGVAFADCRQAIIEHYAESTEWIKPAHVATRAATIAHHRRYLERKAADDARLGRTHQPEVTPGDLPPGPPPLRNRTAELHALIESFRVAPDGTERWSATGDPAMRRRQAASVNPEVIAAAGRASRAKARAMVAESRGDGAPGRE